MTSIGDAFAAGDLPGAIAAATAAVKAAPRDGGKRWLLAELLLFAGDAERADRMLDAVLSETPSPAVLEFRQLLRAEQARAQLFTDGRAPRFQGDDATAAQTAALRALALARAGDLPGAAEAAAASEAARPRAPGRFETAAGGTAFDDLRDADDFFGPQLEILTNAGVYMLVPFERIASLVFAAPVRPRDLYWRKTELTLRDGTEGQVFVPAIYPSDGLAPDDPRRLGRATDWPDPGAGPARGRGQRLLLAGDDAVALGELHALHFAAP